MSILLFWLIFGDKQGFWNSKSIYFLFFIYLRYFRPKNAKLAKFNSQNPTKIPEKQKSTPCFSWCREGPVVILFCGSVLSLYCLVGRSCSWLLLFHPGRLFVKDSSWFSSWSDHAAYGSCRAVQGLVVSSRFCLASSRAMYY